MKNLFDIAKKSGYPLDAYLFVQRGLDHTVRWLHGDESPLETEEALFEAHDPAESPSTSDLLEGGDARHVTGQQLCLGLREFAIDQYGPMARTVLKRWGIRSSRDFGAIVFHMVEAGMMHKTDDDSIQDFINVYRFEEAFCVELSLEPNQTLRTPAYRRSKAKV